MLQSEIQAQDMCYHLNVFLKAAHSSCSHNIATVVIVEMASSSNSDGDLKMSKQM